MTMSFNTTHAVPSNIHTPAATTTLPPWIQPSQTSTEYWVLRRSRSAIPALQRQTLITCELAIWTPPTVEM